MPYEANSFNNHPSRLAPVEKPLPERLADTWDKQRETNDVREESWGQQEGTRNEDHRAVDDRACGNLTLIDLRLDALPHKSALSGDEVRAKHCSYDNYAERRPDADPGTDRVEQRDLNDGYCKKTDEQPRTYAHGVSVTVDR